MRCEAYQEWIQRQLDNDLTSSEEQELENHVRSCPRCAEERAILLDLSSQLNNLPDVKPSFSLTEAVMTQIAADDKVEEQKENRQDKQESIHRHPIQLKDSPLKRKRRWWWLGGSAIAAGIMAILFLPLILPAPNDHSNQGQPSNPPSSKGSNSGGLGIQSEGDAQKVNPSEDSSANKTSSSNGTYKATISNQQIVILNQSGKEVYRSKSLSNNERVAKMDWQGKDQLTLWVRSTEGNKGQRGEIVTINLPSKTEKRSPWR
ncbi:Putative zinc-finger [Marininema mesophilum]|uniref:Anti-sigma-W factor RsiW n=1 Tax=Marininema mesophilum TaxID=1048340 RepID=A0A1H2Y0E5_9BACL|nr:zf-HC2 domain-containing protein [Marininema mesophilum]SDW98606.1 Putative zinc-finger [Marininema mesophilum]